MSVVSAERTKHGYGLGTEEGEAFWLLGMLETIKIGGEDTGGQYGLPDTWCAPSKAPLARPPRGGRVVLCPRRSVHIRTSANPT